MACAVAGCVVDGSGVKDKDVEAAARNRRAIEQCTREAGVEAKMIFGTCPFLHSPLRRERSRGNTLAWTRTTRSGARGLLVDSATCSVAVRVVGDVRVEVDNAEAVARSRRAMERCKQRGRGRSGSGFLDVPIRSLTTQA